MCVGIARAANIATWIIVDNCERGKTATLKTTTPNNNSNNTTMTTPNNKYNR